LTSIYPAGAPNQAIQIWYSANSNPTSTCQLGAPSIADAKPCKIVPASGPEMTIHWTTASSRHVISWLELNGTTVAAYSYDGSGNLQYYYRGNSSSPEK